MPPFLRPILGRVIDTVAYHPDSRIHLYWLGRLGNPNVKKVAVFGNTGGGKSTLARKLAERTRIPFFPLDMIEFRAGGGKVSARRIFEGSRGAAG